MLRFNIVKINYLLNEALRPSCNTEKLRYISKTCFVSSGNELGRGSGKGGGKGGAIRDAGGSFGKKEAAHEEEYFKRMEREQVKNMKKYLENELESHEEEIQSHEEAIKRHKLRIEEIKDAVKKC